jgi:putative two-component system response regulator
MIDMQHAINVSALTQKISFELGISEAGRILLSAAGLFHDIGKLGVPAELLNKPDALSSDEHKIIQWHTTIGYHMLNNMPDAIHKFCAQAALYHHERMDGSGYLKLTGEQIPFSARLIAVVDIYDALTSDRPYRQAWSQDDAIDFLNEQAGIQLDPMIVAALIASVRNAAMSPHS